MPKQVEPKHPDIFCAEGKPLGQFTVKCQATFDAAAEQNRGRHGFKGGRVMSAATEIICGLDHLTRTHNLELRDAYRFVSKAIKERHNLTAPLIHAAFTTASQHWTRGQELADVMLGRAPN